MYRQNLRRSSDRLRIRGRDIAGILELGSAETPLTQHFAEIARPVGAATFVAYVSGPTASLHLLLTYFFGSVDALKPNGSAPAALEFIVGDAPALAAVPILAVYRLAPTQTRGIKDATIRIILYAPRVNSDPLLFARLVSSADLFLAVAELSKAFKPDEQHAG